jgi:hypothetical protein
VAEITTPYSSKLAFDGTVLTGVENRWRFANWNDLYRELLQAFGFDRYQVMGAAAVWLFSLGRGEQTSLGVVLTLLVVCGFIVRNGRVRWYDVGVACVFTALLLGSVHGPLFDEATTGYCESMFEPFEPGHVLPDDAPPRTYERCEEARRERIPVIAVLAVVGVATLAVSLRRRRVPTPTREPVTTDAR